MINIFVYCYEKKNDFYIEIILFEYTYLKQMYQLNCNKMMYVLFLFIKYIKFNYSISFRVSFRI